MLHAKKLRVESQLPLSILLEDDSVILYSWIFPTSIAISNELVWHFVRARGVSSSVISSTSPSLKVFLNDFSNSSEKKKLNQIKIIQTKKRQYRSFVLTAKDRFMVRVTLSSYTVEPRYNKWRTANGLAKICSLQRGFVISRFLFHMFYYYWGKENRSLYRGLRYIEVRSLYRGSTVSSHDELLQYF